MFDPYINVEISVILQNYGHGMVLVVLSANQLRNNTTCVLSVIMQITCLDEVIMLKQL